jgi:hypothetical protein
MEKYLPLIILRIDTFTFMLVALCKCRAATVCVVRYTKWQYNSADLNSLDTMCEMNLNSYCTKTGTVTIPGATATMK